MSFLGTAPRPFHFERAKDEVLPLGESLVIRDGVVSFGSSFSKCTPAGLDDDVSFLKSLELDECAYGAASLPIRPFVCELGSTAEPSARRVLDALKASSFRSEHISDLEKHTIPFPGYHPDTDNDEIHDDPGEQYLFKRPDEGGSAGHDALRRYVPQLWYVSLHTAKVPKGPDPNLPAELQMTFYLSDHVILFGVGRSHDRLIGVIAHQNCYNLCD